MQRQMNNEVAKVRTDVVANLVRPGAFTSVERGLIFHIRDRVGETQFRGIFIDDNRNSEEHTTVVAEYGQIVQRPEGAFLVMRDGNIERRRPKERDPTIVVFEQYAFDLTRLAQTPQSVIGLHEMYIWELLFPAPDNEALRTSAGQFRVELHERLLAPIYPLAFGVIAFAVLGFPRTTRQSRTVSLVAVIVGVAGLRLGGFAVMAMAVNHPPVVIALYAALAATLVLGAIVIWRGRPLDLDENMTGRDEVAPRRWSGSSISPPRAGCCCRSTACCAGSAVRRRPGSGNGLPPAALSPPASMDNGIAVRYSPRAWPMAPARCAGCLCSTD